MTSGRLDLCLYTHIHAVAKECDGPARTHAPSARLQGRTSGDKDNRTPRRPLAAMERHPPDLPSRSRGAPLWPQTAELSAPAWCPKGTIGSDRTNARPRRVRLRCAFNNGARRRVQTTITDMWVKLAQRHLCIICVYKRRPQRWRAPRLARGLTPIRACCSHGACLANARAEAHLERANAPLLNSLRLWRHCSHRRSGRGALAESLQVRRS